MTRTFTVKIVTENDAFEPDARDEISRILRRVARDVFDGLPFIHVRDRNGNQCGSVAWRLPSVERKRPGREK
jgi:hypothetical protein